MFSVLGVMLLVSAGSLITVYLGLELFSLPAFALVALNRDARLPPEAAIKYFVLSALASGMLLYGMSWPRSAWLIVCSKSAWVRWQATGR